MRKELPIAAALAALLAAPALAQNTPPTAPTAAPPTAPGPTSPAGSPATPASPITPPSATSPGPASSTVAAPAAGAPSFVQAQQDQEMLASDLIGTPVYNAENQSLGEINDVLLAQDGRLKAVVVGVGGFLGIAERDVAVPWDTIGVSRDDDQDLTLRLEVRREQLEQAPAFTTVAERRAAERAAGAVRNPPATGLGTPGAGTGAGGAVVPAPVPGATPPAPAQ
jgi:sporulation protein YlmC with PRC-barrel domain